MNMLKFSFDKFTIFSSYFCRQRWRFPRSRSKLHTCLEIAWTSRRVSRSKIRRRWLQILYESSPKLRRPRRGWSRPPTKPRDLSLAGSFPDSTRTSIRRRKLDFRWILRWWSWIATPWVETSRFARRRMWGRRGRPKRRRKRSRLGSSRFLWVI